MAKPKHYWWHGTEFVELIEAVTRRGADNVRVVFYPEDEAHDNRPMFYVRPEAQTAALHEEDCEGEECGPFNFAHICPPECD